MLDQEKLQEILLSKDQQKISDFLLKLRDQRRLDELFQSILELFQKSSVSEFSISQLILNEFVVYFRELSPLVSFEYSKLLLQLLNSLGNDKKMLKSLVVILRLLIENIPLLSARQTRDLIKSDQMIEICSHFWNLEQGIAANLTFCLFQIIIFELNYFLSVSTEKSQKQLIKELTIIWTKLIEKINIQNFEQCPFLQICTVILLNITSTLEKADTINNICKIIFRKIRKNCLFEKCTEIIQDDVCVENVNIVELNIDENQNNILCSYNSVSHFLKTKTPSNISFFVSQKNPSIRFGEFRQSIETSLINVLPSHFIKNGILNWSKLAKERLKRRKTPKCDFHNDWNSLLEIFEKIDDEVQGDTDGILLRNLSKKTITQIISSVPFKQLANSPLKTICASLKLLHLLASQQHKVELPFTIDLINLMEAEPEPKIYSIKIVERILKFHTRQPEMLADLRDLSGLCFAMFRPLDQPWTEQISEPIKRKYLLAELSFLRTFLVSVPILLNSFSPVITQLLPEFFIQSSNYRRKQALNSNEISSPRDINYLVENLFPDRLEHSLSCVCRELVKNREKFHRLLSFVVASSLVDERRIRYPTYLIMTALDEKDIALLSTNMPTWEKRKFSALHSQFFECNKIIG
uniref:Uncharacterized protein n=1 Tax=Meloidogyne enterolobii TaxID=390850 RepID=A0A6V7TSA9_MELEN|nr:unnamed protein product [Meloidogyne enterolobii]